MANEKPQAVIIAAEVYATGETYTPGKQCGDPGDGTGLLPVESIIEDAGRLVLVYAGGMRDIFTGPYRVRYGVPVKASTEQVQCWRCQSRFFKGQVCPKCGDANPEPPPEAEDDEKAADEL